MKNITVSVDEETHHLARVRAAELGTSVSALVREFLKTLVTYRDGGPEGPPHAHENESERRRRLVDSVFKEVRATRPGFSASNNIPRSELYRSSEVC